MAQRAEMKLPSALRADGLGRLSKTILGKGMKRTRIRQLLGQVLSFPVRAVGGISLKVSPSFSYALIRGWVCAKTPASLGHSLRDGGSQMVDVLEVVPAVTRSNRAVWHDGDWQSRGERALIWGCVPSKLKADTRPRLHLLSG